MKRINNKLAMALLRGAVALSGIMTTVCVAFFTESLNSCILALLTGASVTVLIDEIILNYD